MSVTISLIPLALAAAGAWSAASAARAADAVSDRADARDADRPAVSVRTRMKDAGLLEAALADIGATGISIGDEVTADVSGVRLTMERDADGVWQAHVAGELSDAELTAAGADLVARLDAAYAARVQSAVAQRIRERAGAAGFELASEQREGDTVTMMLTVRDRA